MTRFHTPIIPRRHAVTYFDLYEPERRAISILLDRVRAQILERDGTVGGFNIGMNVGETAGQRFRMRMLVALKLTRSSLRDRADVVELIKTGQVDLSGWPFSSEILAGLEALVKVARTDPACRRTMGLAARRWTDALPSP